MSSDPIAELEDRLSRAAGGLPQDEVDALNALAWEIGTKDEKRTKSLTQRALALSRCGDFPDWPYQKGIAFSQFILGYIAAQSADFSAALSHFTEARAILEIVDLPNPELLMRVFKELGWVYYNLGDLPQAFAILFKALKISQESGSPEIEATVLISLSNVYSESGNLDASVRALRRAIAYLEGSDKRRDYCLALNNLAMTLLDQKLFDEALGYAAQSVEIARQMNLPNVLVSTLDTTSQIYLARQEFTLAENLLNEALTIHQGFGNDLAEIYLNLARVKIGQNHLAEAQQILLHSLPSVEARGVNRFIFQYHKLLAEIFENQADFVNAITHYKRFHEIKSRVFNEETQRQVSSLMVLHQEETARMDAEIFNLKNQTLRLEVIERRKAVAEMNVLATTDQLTGFLNRRHFMTLAGYAFEYAQHARTPVSMLMIDIDHFKRVNDLYGHLTGDRVLTLVCANLQSGLRIGDLPCRYGGEEFLVLLPSTNLKDAQKVAERLLNKVGETTMLVENQPILVTVSIGVAQAEIRDTNLETVMERADRALYIAKQSGRSGVKVLRASES